MVGEARGREAQGLDGVFAAHGYGYSGPSGRRCRTCDSDVCVRCCSRAVCFLTGHRADISARGDAMRVAISSRAACALCPATPRDGSRVGGLCLVRDRSEAASPSSRAPNGRLCGRSTHQIRERDAIMRDLCLKGDPGRACNPIPLPTYYYYCIICPTSGGRAGRRACALLTNTL